MLSGLLPRNIYEFIARVTPPSIFSGSDTPPWKGSHDGNFSTKSAYAVMTNNTNFYPQDPLFRLIWKWKGIERVRIFMGQMASNSLMTNESSWYEGLHKTIPMH